MLTPLLHVIFAPLDFLVLINELIRVRSHDIVHFSVRVLAHVLALPLSDDRHLALAQKLPSLISSHSQRGDLMCRVFHFAAAFLFITVCSCDKSATVSDNHPPGDTQSNEIPSDEKPSLSLFSKLDDDSPVSILEE